jgi:hypothetical protein
MKKLQGDARQRQLGPEIQWIRPNLSHSRAEELVFDDDSLELAATKIFQALYSPYP